MPAQETVKRKAFIGKVPRYILGFEVYYAMGEARSYQRVADRLGVGQKHVQCWGRKHKWPQRVAERDIELYMKTDDHVAGVVNRVRSGLMELINESVSVLLTPVVDEVTGEVEGTPILPIRNMTDLEKLAKVLESLEASAKGGAAGTLAEAIKAVFSGLE